MRVQDQGNDRGESLRTGAGRVAARSTPTGPAAGLLALQRSVGNAAVTQAIEEERHEHGPGCSHAGRSAQRRMDPEAEQGAVQRRVSLAEVTGAGGLSLPPRIQNKAEQAYQMPFNHVRVHNDETAQRASAEFGARAMTVENHIVLGSSSVDDETWFHELDHVRQQSKGKVAGSDDGSGNRVSSPGDPFELQSSDNGRRVAQGENPDLSMPGMAGHGEPVQRAKAGPGERESVQRMPTSGGRVSKAKKGSGQAKTVAQAITAALVNNHGWQEYGGAQNKTVHLPVASDSAPEHAKSEGLKGAAMSKMYHGTGNISDKRSFADKGRVEQALRWISTVTFNYLNDLSKQPEEVQAGISTTDAAGPDGTTAKKYELYISSNKNSANKALNDLYAGQTNARAFLAAILEANEPNLASRTAREQRHAQKLAKRILGSKDGVGQYGAVLQALAGPVNVPANAEEDGLHAERRIMDSAPEKSISNDQIAGVKRPCMVCYMELFVGDDSKRPGPFWPSKASNIGQDDYTVANAAKLAARIHQAAVQGGGTHVTLRVDCEGQERVETKYGSESDSPASGSDRHSSPEAMDTSA
ncbi:DUF4157 domain-containing protein [Streptomyces sp. NPDC059096]|uniref:eCIS core domain-containing protein n=1 Tax=unclassified Streptomyces TaxID=2593676 RepID=UPI0036900B6F